MDGAPDAYGVILFHTNSAALKAEKALLRERVKIKLIPVPRQLSSDCGVAIRFDWGEEGRLRELLGRGGVPFDSIHPLPATDKPTH
ncbi:MAG: DUF3343 domain-containing protein [Acidobacteriota bacterium]|nr:DUF3343 domain-containing protein [Acidobacteriota bacterium]